MNSQTQNEGHMNRAQRKHYINGEKKQDKSQRKQRMGVSQSQEKQDNSNNHSKTRLENHENHSQRQQQKLNHQNPNSKQQQQKQDIKKQSQLLKKCQSLFKELQKVKIQLNEIKQRQKKQNTENKGRVKTSLSVQKQEEYFIKADNLIRRIQEQREERVMNRKKSLHRKRNSQSVNENSMQLVKDQVSLKEQRRQFILKRIEERKQFAQMRKEINKRSNSLIKLLIEKDKPSNHNDSTNEETNNTQQTQPSSQLQSSHKRKKYQPGHFLVQLLKEEERLKSEEKLKTIERRQVILKHKQYSQKLRSRTRAQSTYLTQIDNT